MLSMHAIADMLQSLARRQGRAETRPLALLRTLDAVTGERISHLPIDRELADAWIALAGEQFRPHHAHALAALRRAEPTALRSDVPAVDLSALLLCYATLADSPGRSALLLTPNDDAAWQLHTRLDGIAATLPVRQRRRATLCVAGQRPDLFAPFVVATPEGLHNRLLRHHERAWSTFWQGVRLVHFADIHAYQGVAAAHLADLLLRAQRVAAAHGAPDPLLLATLHGLGEPDAALRAIAGQPWRIIAADDFDTREVTLAVWQAGASRLREVAEVATGLQRQGLRVHVLCGSLDRAALAPILGDVPGITVGPDLASAQAVILAGYPGSHAVVRRALRSGAQAVVLVLGDLPHEQALVHMTETLVRGEPPAWVAAAPNAYVTAQHVVCAASELPLTAAETEAWGANEIVARLVEHGRLVDLPDPEIAWKPATDEDPYADMDLMASSGGAIEALNEQNQLIARLDPTGFERWTFPGAALPAGAGGLRVRSRDEEAGRIVLRHEANGRRTLPLRRCTAEVREVRQERALQSGHQVGHGRVVVQEEITGYREHVPGQPPVDRQLDTALQTRWVAPACWFVLPVALQPQGQLVGWCMTAALALRTTATMTDLAPCYDPATRRVYLVDTQPGGQGLAAWIFANAETLLKLAYDVALACRTDPLFEPLSRTEQDWLLALLGRGAEVPVIRPREPLTPDTPPRTPGPAPKPEAGEQARPSVPPPLARSEPPLPTRNEPRARIPDPAPTPEAGERSDALPAGGRGERSAPPPAHAEPPRPPEPAPTPSAADADALVERLRRQREARERQDLRNAPPRPVAKASVPGAPAVARFAVGDKIFCLPYGDGEVRASRVIGDRERLIVDFPGHGELMIDPAVSLVRKIEEPAAQEDDLL